MTGEGDPATLTPLTPEEHSAVLQAIYDAAGSAVAGLADAWARDGRCPGCFAAAAAVALGQQAAWFAAVEAELATDPAAVAARLAATVALALAHAVAAPPDVGGPRCDGH